MGKTKEWSVTAVNLFVEGNFKFRVYLRVLANYVAIATPDSIAGEFMGFSEVAVV